MLPVAVALLVIGSFLPARFLGPAGWFGDLLATLSAPVSQPARAMAGWLAPASPESTEPEAVRELEREVQYYRTLYERMRERNNDLLRQMEQLRLIVSLNPDLNVRNLTAPVVGATADLGRASLQIRAGRGQGVDRNDVIVVEGVQLFGRVERAGERVSWIRPITAERSNSEGGSDSLGGQVMIEDGRGLQCLLRPVGDGLLKGDVAYDAGSDQQAPGAASPIAAGQIVRLDDGAWPASAQMLIIGRIESVEPAPDSPLRQIITVRPTVALDRVTEVIVRISEEDDG